MLDKNVENNQARLRDEIKEIKEYISLLEHEVNASDHVARLSENQFQLIFRKLQTTANCASEAGYYWAHFANDKELKGKLVDLELKISHDRREGGK